MSTTTSNNPIDDVIAKTSSQVVVLRSDTQLEVVVEKMTSEDLWATSGIRPINISPTFALAVPLKPTLHYAFARFETVKDAQASLHIITKTADSMNYVLLHSMEVKLLAEADEDAKSLYSLVYEANTLSLAAAIFLSKYDRSTVDTILATYPSRLADAREAIEDASRLSETLRSSLQNASIKGPPDVGVECKGGADDGLSESTLETLMENGNALLKRLQQHHEEWSSTGFLSLVSAPWIDAVEVDMRLAVTWSEAVRVYCEQNSPVGGQEQLPQDTEARDDIADGRIAVKGDVRPAREPSEVSLGYIPDISPADAPHCSPTPASQPWLLNHALHIFGLPYNTMLIIRGGTFWRAVNCPAPILITPVTRAKKQTKHDRQGHVYALWDSAVEMPLVLRAIAGADLQLSSTTDASDGSEIHIKGLVANLISEDKLSRLCHFVQMMREERAKQATAEAQLKEYNELLKKTREVREFRVGLLNQAVDRVTTTAALVTRTRTITQEEPMSGASALKGLDSQIFELIDVFRTHVIRDVGSVLDENSSGAASETNS